MAVLYQCDRCKETVTEQKDLGIISISRFGRVYGQDEVERGDSLVRDLCLTCLKIIHAALTMTPKG